MSLPPIDLGQNGAAEMPDGYLGMVVEGSLTNGVEVRLSGGSSGGAGQSWNVRQHSGRETQVLWRRDRRWPG